MTIAGGALRGVAGVLLLRDDGPGSTSVPEQSTREGHIDLEQFNQRDESGWRNPIDGATLLCWLRPF